MKYREKKYEATYIVIFNEKMAWVAANRRKDSKYFFIDNTKFCFSFLHWFLFH